MARYKVLKSVAHSMVHSFTSDLNYRDDDYVMCHLLKAMLRSHTPSLHVDFLSGAAEPAELLVPAVESSIASFVQWFPSLVQSHKTAMDFVSGATMTITFDLSKGRAWSLFPDLVEFPFVGKCEVVDNRGKGWQAEVVGWWSPDGGTPVNIPIAPVPRSSLPEMFSSIWNRAIRRL